MGKIFGILSIIVVVVVGYLGFEYYDKTYKTSTAYAITPTKIPIKEHTKDDSGNVVDNSYSFKYSVIFIKENGDKQKMNFKISGENPKPFDPGSYIKAEISKNRVNAPTQITDNEIPSKVKVEIINKN